MLLAGWPREIPAGPHASDPIKTEYSNKCWKLLALADVKGILYNILLENIFINLEAHSTSVRSYNRQSLVI